MDNRAKFFPINLKAWNKRVEAHFNSKFYDNESFISGHSSLNSIELGLLGDVRNKSLLHLQCHFGQDTLSWARMGANVTGIDISDKAIEKAKELRDTIGEEAQFVTCNVLDTREFVRDIFDIVFTSYGSITWLPDLEPWAKVVADSLKPGGMFCIAGFHPMMWTLDDEFKSFGYSYFNQGANHDVGTGTYADDEGKVEVEEYWWTHPISDIARALLDQGMTLKRMDEYDYSAYNCLPNMEKIEERKYRLKNLGNTIPYMFSMLWEKT